MDSVVGPEVAHVVLEGAEHAPLDVERAGALALRRTQLLDGSILEGEVQRVLFQIQSVRQLIRAVAQSDVGKLQRRTTDYRYLVLHYSIRNAKPFSRHLLERTVSPKGIVRLWSRWNAPPYRKIH